MDIIEILKQIFSATDDQTSAFSAAMKEHGIYTTSHENMDVRYPKLKGDYETLNKQYGEANGLIEDMKKATKGQEALQSKITTYEGTIQQLQAENQQLKIDSAIKVGLLSEKAVDVDYLAFKLNEKLRSDGETLALDENGNIKGWNDKVEALKTQFPNQFESSGGNGDGYEVYKPNDLRHPDGNPGDKTITKEQFDKMGYNSKVALRQENPDLYNRLTKG